MNLMNWCHASPPGNPMCNPSTWNDFPWYTGKDSDGKETWKRGYRDSCCSDQEKCGEYEGDCNSDSECYGSLVCEYNGCPFSKGFSKHASCCKQPSGTYKLSKE